MICPPHLRSAALLTGLAAGIAIPGFTTNAAEPNQGRPSSAGESPQGHTGAQTLHEGTQPGAPGNLVTAAEGTVLQGLDENSDGLVSKDEAKTNGTLARQFVALDKNGDGKLDEAEFKRFQPDESAATGAAPTTAAEAKGEKNSKPRM